MDSPFKNMYDTLKDDIWKELGPLDPDWFDALTAQTFISEENGCDQDDLHANQEETFKTPFDKTAADSQLFSTPKVFRCSRVVSPEIVDDEWSTAEQEKETLPWRATQSPCLYRMSKDGVQGPKYGGIQPQSHDSFDLLHTPQKSPVSYAKNISESLGAQIHPDMSWTSSLNTPPVPSTLILTKTDESPCPVSASADKNVVFVRKLFPSLSNASTVGVVSPKNTDIPTVHQGVVSPEAGQNPESHDSPHTPLNQNDGVWRQRLPDAIEDREIRSTVESVLDGAENVLSIFFTNSSSALRKVKTDRIKRKQIIPTKEHYCSSPDISAASNNASSKQRTADQEPGRHPSSPPVKTEDVGITQWSPLSLSEIPPCTADASSHNNNPATQVENSILTNQVQSNPDSGQRVRPPAKITYSGITKKRRTFVYTVETLKPQTQGNTETHFQKMDSSPGIPDSAPGNLPERTAVSLPSIHASGFKTASNKGIQISSANLERAKRLFEEPEGEQTSSDQPTKCAHVTKAEIGSNGSVNNTTSNTNQLTSSSGKCVDISCQLTASQKADVTELCTLLEEADSQFEFTQFKTAKLKQHSQDFATAPQKADKDLDPDFLMGIDFDDSFNSDAGKHLAVTVMPDKMILVSDSETNCETSNIRSKSEDLSLPNAIKMENSSTEDVSSSSKRISECRGNRAGHVETNKLENTNSLMLGVGFKTAGGNILRVSKKCLSKARALFADLEENQKSSDKDISETNSKALHKRSVDIHTNDLLHHKEDHLKFTGHSNNTGGRIQGCFSNMKESVCPDRQVAGIRDQDASIGFKNSKMDPATCQSGFQMASGKGICVSAKAMQEADAFFKDCDAMDTNTAVFVKQKKGTGALLGSVSHEVNPQKFQNVERMKENFSEGSINVKAGPPVHHTEVVQNNGEIHNLGFQRAPASTNADSSKVLSSLSCTVSKNTGSSVIAELGSGGGFCTASGEKVLVSADAMKKAEFLLNEIHTLEDANKQQDQKGADLNTPHLTNPIQVSLAKNVGFQTASGKGVAISFAALKKAKSLLSECDDVEDKIGVKTHSKIPFHGPPHRNSGFRAACSKPVALSSEGLQKEKAFFSDIGFSAEGPAVSDTKRTEKQDNAENTEKIHCGFSTAGGAKVHVSQKNLLKAKNLLKEFDDDDDSVLAKAMQETDAFFTDCDIVDGNNGMSVKHKKSTALTTGNGSEKKNLSKFKTDQRVTVNSFGEPESGHTDFDNMPGGPVVDHEMVLYHDVENHKAVFKNTLDSANASTLHGTLSLMAQPLSSQLCTASKSTGGSAINESSNAGGFCTASGKKGGQKSMCRRKIF
ncbi:uncharacterized protein [Pempheris klunzingeri]|uniref:uncharacterized protein n=1 Tax=Pempheris klunzingeri TaxID=3127111 RepID=UPI003980A543